MTYDAAPGDRIGAYTGLYYLFGSLAAIVGPPLAGVLVDATGSYRAIFLFGPVFMALALLLMSRARGVEARKGARAAA